ncbi:hypothetical protein Fmac_023654 [Flemingia macrophylla]|uniref:Uncharacterized protein n=1 Tax=Flemingia macrophylla TaxID=520843 RepID=A0ABD1LM45_9FABA
MVMDIIDYARFCLHFIFLFFHLPPRTQRPLAQLQQCRLLPPAPTPPEAFPNQIWCRDGSNRPWGRYAGEIRDRVTHRRACFATTHTADEALPPSLPRRLRRRLANHAVAPEFRAVEVITHFPSPTQICTLAYSSSTTPPRAAPPPQSSPSPFPSRSPSSVHAVVAHPHQNQVKFPSAMVPFMCCFHLTWDYTRAHTLSFNSSDVSKTSDCAPVNGPKGNHVFLSLPTSLSPLFSMVYRRTPRTVFPSKQTGAKGAMGEVTPKIDIGKAFDKEYLALPFAVIAPLTMKLNAYFLWMSSINKHLEASDCSHTLVYMALSEQYGMAKFYYPVEHIHLPTATSPTGVAACKENCTYNKTSFIAAMLDSATKGFHHL